MSPRTEHRLALGFLGFGLVVLPLLHVPGTSDPVVPVQLLAMSGLVAALLLVMGLDGVRMGWGRWSLLCWLAFLGWGAVASCAGMVPWEGLLETSRLLVVTGLGLLCCRVLRVLAEPSKWLAALCAGALVMVGGVGVGQQWGIWTGIPGYNGLPTGTLGNANFYGAAMQLLIPGAVLGLRRGGWQRALSVLGLVVGGLGLYFSDSEGAWLGAGVSGVVSLAYLLPAMAGKAADWKLGLRGWALAGLAVVGLVVAVAIGWGLTRNATAERIDMTQDSGRERWLLWEGSVRILEAHPLLGCGPGNWNYAILEQGVVGASQGFGTRYYMQAHSDYLQAFAEAGVLGGLLFLGFLGLAWVKGWRVQRNGGSGESTWLQGLGLGALSGWMVNAGLSFPLHEPYLVLLLMVWLSVVAGGHDHSRAVPRSLLRGAWAVILLAALGWMAWSTLKIKGNADNFKVLAAKEAMNFPAVAKLAAEAQTWYNADDGISKTPLAWYEGNAMLNLGQQKEALEVLERAWKQNPWHPMVANNYAIALAVNGRVEEAIPMMEGLLARFPEFDETRANLARLYIATRRLRQAGDLVRHWDGEGTSAMVNQIREELKAAQVGADSVGD